MIKISDIMHHYGIRPVLKHVSLEIKAGELVGLMGPNGMGKSTLLGIIAGILDPVKGYVEIDGLRRNKSPEQDLEIKTKIAYLPDHPWYPKNRTGREFLEAVGRVYEIPTKRLDEQINNLMHLFDLEKKADSMIRSYSNGQQKKLAVASVLVSEAKILILDEPFSGGLDPSSILALKKVLKWYAERKDVTVIMATPVPEIVEQLADRIAILRFGELAAFDTVEGLLKMCNCEGNLGDVLEHLINPQTMKNIEDYFVKDEG